MYKKPWKKYLRSITWFKKITTKIGINELYSQFVFLNLKEDSNQKKNHRYAIKRLNKQIWEIKQDINWLLLCFLLLLTIIENL